MIPYDLSLIHIFGIFEVMSKKILTKVNNTRQLGIVLIVAAFFSAMFLTNDVALITLVPFGLLVLKNVGKMKYAAFLVSLLTVAANIGSMLTPFGNPQNLYLYSFYQFKGAEFFRITLPVTVFAFCVIIVAGFFLKKEEIKIRDGEENEFAKKKELLIYGVLFFLCVLSVFRIIHYAVLVIVLCSVVFFLNKGLFKKVDYGLLGTFVCFFIFAGNMGNIEQIRLWILEIIEGRIMLAGILTSQIISNVPAAILLSGFTENGMELVLGTNIGGLGTFVASLASLISYKLYRKSEDGRPGRYLAVFTAVNAVVLILLTGFVFLWYFAA